MLSALLDELSLVLSTHAGQLLNHSSTSRSNALSSLSV